jgi:hypothetical protein
LSAEAALAAASRMLDRLATQVDRHDPQQLLRGAIDLIRLSLAGEPPTVDGVSRTNQALLERCAFYDQQTLDEWHGDAPPPAPLAVHFRAWMRDLYKAAADLVVAVQRSDRDVARSVFRQFTSCAEAINAITDIFQVGSGNIIPTLREQFEQDLHHASKWAKTSSSQAIGTSMHRWGPLWPNENPLPFIVQLATSEPSDEVISAAERALGATRRRRMPPLAVYIDPGEASVEDLQEFFEALSGLFGAVGAPGLRFEVGGGFVRASTGVTL